VTKSYDFWSSWSVQKARGGNFTLLTQRLRDKNSDLSDVERTFIADYLDGKVKPRRPKQRRKGLPRDELLADMVVERIVYCQTIDPTRKLESILSYVGELFGVSRRYVLKKMKETDPDRLEAMKACASAEPPFTAHILAENQPL
jgi:hypothetical protein